MLESGKIGMKKVDVYRYERIVSKDIKYGNYIEPSVMNFILNSELKVEMSIGEIIDYINSQEINILNITNKENNEVKFNYIKTYVEILKEKSIKLLYYIERIQFNRDNRHDYSIQADNEVFLESIKKYFNRYDIDVCSYNNWQYGLIKYQDMYRLLQPLIENISDLNFILNTVNLKKDIDIAYNILLDEGMICPSRSLQDIESLYVQRGNIPLSDRQLRVLKYENDIFEIWKEKVKCKKI